MGRPAQSASIDRAEIERRPGLLVLDWEFAYSGPALMDVGQLIRWDPPDTFVSAFAASDRENGGELADDWQRSAQIFGLFNLAGLLTGAAPESRRSTDVLRRIEQTVPLDLT